MAFAIMSDEESTNKGKKAKGHSDTAVVAVEDNGWKKEGSCKCAVTDPKTGKSEEVDGFKWSKHVADGTQKGKDYEIYLPVGVTPSQYGVTV